jgi:hypothetical protein
MASFTVFPYPIANGCSNFSVDCSDPNSVLIHTILSLANPNGVTSQQIHSHVSYICPQLSWTYDDLQTYLNNALRRGVILTIYQENQSNTLAPLYAVNAGMARINPSNRKYFCICQLYKSPQH